MTLVCVPIMVEDADAAMGDARLAKGKGADMVEWRVDAFFHGTDDEGEAWRAGAIERLVAGSPLPCIVTCRPAWEGGEYEGAEDERVALFERLAECDHPPAYIDIELAAWTRDAGLRAAMKRCVRGPDDVREPGTRLILSIHDFEGRPTDLDRRLLSAYDEPACSVVKVALRSRSIRDNLELFEILGRAPKPTIALGMGRFGVMSRVLAPKFGGLLTFASLRDESATAPGQPTIDELLRLYRFRSIGRQTKVYGIIGWPVEQSMSPLVHNAGFEAVGHDGVYVPMPIAADADDPEGSDASFKATMLALIEDERLGFAGASVTIPHKEHLARLAQQQDWPPTPETPSPSEEFQSSRAAEQQSSTSEGAIGACNTIVRSDAQVRIANTDASAACGCLENVLGSPQGRVVCLIGAGGVARAIAFGLVERGAEITIVNRSAEHARALTDSINQSRSRRAHRAIEGSKKIGHRDDPSLARRARWVALQELSTLDADALINCTPVGMNCGPDPDGLSIPIPDMKNITPETVFFDTVYNPVETPMLREARERGCRTIDGAAMFVKQAAAQFELWTGKAAPVDLFDRLVREKLAADENAE